MRALLARLLGLIAALLVCAWFALGIRQSHDVDVASSLVTSSGGALAPPIARRAGSLLRAAGALNPDTTVALLRSHLALREGDRRRAQAIALAVVREEPQNIEAWVAYGSASAHDPPAFRRALRELERLAPPVRAHR
jgi:hypothetical protein